MKRYIYTLLVLLAIPMLMNAQSLLQAKKQMDKFNYVEAIKTLKVLSDSEKTKNAAIPLLGECYRKQRDVQNAKITYAKAVLLQDAKPESFFFYAQALQASGEYEKAKELYLQYDKLNPSDPKGILCSIQCDSVIGPWKQLSPQFEAKLASNINSVQSDFGAAFYSGDLIFASDNINQNDSKLYGWTGRGFLKIKKASPENKGDFWSNMKSPSDFDSKFEQRNHDGPAAFDKKENTIYITRSFYGKVKTEGGFQTNRLKIYSATKTEGVWGDLKPFYLNSDEYSVGHPTLSDDGQTLYFVSDMPGGEGGTDIWMCKRVGDTWGQANNLGSTINTKMNEMFPTIGENDILYFASEGLPGYGGLDIFKTSQLNGKWVTPVNMHPPINSPYDDFALAFAPGEKTGFFSSNRPAGIGSDDIYSFRYKEQPIPVAPAPLAVIPPCITGFVKDKTTMKPASGATIFLLDTKTGIVQVLKTDAEGMYKTCKVKPADYVVKAMLPNTIADCIQFPITVLEPGITYHAPRDLLLDKLVLNKTFKIDNIYYDFDKYNIREDAKPELDKLVQIMHDNAIDVELGSHTDCRGSDKYNDKLSQNRAQSAVDYIISTGISKRRITAKGYGEHVLKNKCADGVECTPEEHQENRRTEFKVTNFSPVETVLEFDLSKFKGDEEVPAYVFGSTFFDVCSPKRQSSEKTGNPSKTELSETNNSSQALSKEYENTKASNKTSILNPNSYIYRVQFMAITAKKPTDDPSFGNLANVLVYPEKGIYKYSAGLFKTQKEASVYRKKLVALGYTDSFVITYVKGKIQKATQK